MFKIPSYLSVVTINVYFVRRELHPTQKDLLK